MTGLQAVALLLVAVTGTATTLVREPLRQAAAAGIFGCALAALQASLQAPDVALSQIGVGAVAIPAMVLLALAKIREHDR